MIFYVKAKDKLTGNEMVLSVNGQPTAGAAKAHIEKHPPAVGGTHPGFDVVNVSDEPPAMEAAK